MVENFVSVSGISCMDELCRVRRIKKEMGFRQPVVVGYQVSNRSINELTQNKRQPKIRDLKMLDSATRDFGFRTAIHYYTKDNGTVLFDLEKIAERVIDPCDTLLQFNTLPLDLDVLEKVKSFGYNLIFKVAVADKRNASERYAVWKGDNVTDINGGDISLLVNHAVERQEFIDYVMFDQNHGTNLELDLGEESLAVIFGQELLSRSGFERKGLVYAGGINPGNVKEIVTQPASIIL